MTKYPHLKVNEINEQLDICQNLSKFFTNVLTRLISIKWLKLKNIERGLPLQLNKNISDTQSFC